MSRRLSGSQSPSGPFEEDIDLLSPPRFKTRPIQPVASHFTDRDFWATYYPKESLIFCFTFYNISCSKGDIKYEYANKSKRFISYDFHKATSVFVGPVAQSV